MTPYRNILMAAGLLIPAAAMAQTEADALQYGRVNAAATARSLGLGGAGGSYGGDFSAISINPAGAGVYRSSELTLTPVLRINNVNGDYLGSSAGDDKTRLALNNFGLVFGKAAKGSNYQKSAWKSFSLGIGYNRIADFNSKGYYGGTNRESSMAEAFAADYKYNGANQDLVPPYGFLGYWSYLTDENDNALPYERIIKNGGALNQSKSWETKGGINEWSLTVGGNYMEKLMLGASVGLTTYRYDRSINYYEEDATGNGNNDFSYLSYNEFLNSTGVGVNLKLGAIYVVNDVLRIGAAFHSPTWSAFSETSDYEIQTNTEGFKASLGNTGNDANPVTYVQPDDVYQFDYSLRTPWKGILSATVFMGKHGFVTADYEYAAYNSMRYSYSGNSFADAERAINEAIKDTYRGTHNFRLGVEGRMNAFSGRLGFAYYSNPYRNDAFDGQRMDVSAGIGARFGGFFVDLAYIHMMQKVSEYGYPLLVQANDALGIRKTPVPIADLKYGNNLVALTLGFKF